jgi:hypothetical protein
MNESTHNQRMSFKEYISRALLWGLGAGFLGAKASTAINVAVIAPIAERAFGFTLEGIISDILAAMEQERQGKEREMQQKLNQIGATFESIHLQSAELAGSLRQKPTGMEIGHKWAKVIVHPSIVLVLGKRGSGKSALAYGLLEFFGYRLTPYVVGLPETARKLLPEWIGFEQCLEDVPTNSIAVVDEAYLPYHSRESLSEASRNMSRILNLSRQKGLTIIFVSQEARQIDKNIASSANVVIFKDLGMLQLEFDRRELKMVATQAKQSFETVRGDKRRWSYVYSPEADFAGLLENSLPTFWNRKLSHIFAAGVETSATKLPKRMSFQDRIRKARELHQSGASLSQIGRILGVAKSTVHNYIKGYPYAR